MLPGKDETQLIGWNTLLILDLGFDVVDCVRQLDFKRDGLTSESLDEDLYAVTQTQDWVESGLLLDAAVQGRARR